MREGETCGTTVIRRGAGCSTRKKRPISSYKKKGEGIWPDGMKWVAKSELTREKGGEGAMSTDLKGVAGIPKEKTQTFFRGLCR